MRDSRHPGVAEAWGALNGIGIEVPRAALKNARRAPPARAAASDASIFDRV
jgi:hypothetical protein